LGNSGDDQTAPGIGDRYDTGDAENDPKNGQQRPERPALDIPEALREQKVHLVLFNGRGGPPKDRSHHPATA
jgi:hypothetical protein